MLYFIYDCITFVKCLGNAMRKVTELILEQVECADYILLNKVDLIKSQNDIDLMIKILASMNPTAKVFTCTEGKVDPLTIVGSIGGTGAADAGVLDEHRNLVKSVDHGHSHDAHDHSHSHENDNAHREKATTASASACSNTDPTHVHDETCRHGNSHDHSHSSSSDDMCSNTDPTHVHDENCGHGHSHDHNHEATTAEKR